MANEPPKDESPGDIASYRFFSRLPFDGPDTIRTRITYRDIVADFTFSDTKDSRQNLGNLTEDMRVVLEHVLKEYRIRKQLARERLTIDRELADLFAEKEDDGEDSDDN